MCDKFKLGVARRPENSYLTCFFNAFKELFCFIGAIERSSWVAMVTVEYFVFAVHTHAHNGHLDHAVWELFTDENTNLKPQWLTNQISP